MIHEHTHIHLYRRNPMSLFNSAFDLVSNIVTIVAKPVEAVVDIVSVPVKEVADVVKDLADDVKSLKD